MSRHDEQLGFDAIPDRYRGEREKIDEIRDVLGDAGFRAFCEGQVLRYARSKGQDGADREKQRFYQELVAHMDGRGEDPRHRRPDFCPYERPSAQPGPEQALTRRTTITSGEAWLGRSVPVLDHGFVCLVDYMGGDESIVQAARVSYGKGTKTAREDRGLIRYMLRNGHTSPFEQCEIKLHVKMPIFVARQWVRHRTASLNEKSGRYSILEDEFYLPEPGRIVEQSRTNRQGGGEAIGPVDADLTRESMAAGAREAFSLYHDLLNDDGTGAQTNPGWGHQLARELARINLPLSTYTEWYWKIDLHNLLGFLRQRLHPHAQHEIRVYAEAIAQIVEAWVPMAWEAFCDYRLHGASLSRQEVAALRELLQPDVFEEQREERRALADKVGLGSERERAAFWRLLGVL